MVCEFQAHLVYAPDDPKHLGDCYNAFVTVHCSCGKWRYRADDGHYYLADAGQLERAPYRTWRDGELCCALIGNTYLLSKVVATGLDERNRVAVEIDVDAHLALPGAFSTNPRRMVHVDKVWPRVRDLREEHPEYYCPSVASVPSEAHPDYYHSPVYERLERRHAAGLKKCVGAEAYEGSDWQLALAAHDARKPREVTLKRDGRSAYDAKMKKRAPSRCTQCGTVGISTGMCTCGLPGTGHKLVNSLLLSALRHLFPDGLLLDLDGEYDGETADCEYLTGAPSPAAFIAILRAATGLAQADMDDVLAKKVEKISKKGIKYRARTCEFDHIIAVNNRLPGRRDPLAAPFKLEEMPGRDDDGRPNRAARLLSRREHLQFMMKEDNAAKGSSISEHMIEDFRTFERCFYSHNQLKNDDVLARRYLPEPTILANVTAWAAERRAKLGGWYGIGDPAEPV